MRPDDTAALGRLALALGAVWCAAFALLGVPLGFHLYGDGSIFSYAVAAEDAWAFHWHNISGRVAAYTWGYVIPQAWVGATGDAAGGILLYGVLFFAAPAVGLAATRAADRSAGHAVTAWAGAASALLLPLVWGCPTELWISHAAFWPTLALALAPGGTARRAGLGTGMLVLVLSHEGGLIWGVAAAAAAALGAGAGRWVAAVAFVAALPVWVAVKLSLPPDPYVAEVLGRNAFNLVDPATLLDPLPRLIASMLGAYALLGAVLRRGGVGAPWTWAGIAVAAGLALWWGTGRQPLHAEDRYYLRTLLLGGTPVLGLGAALAVAGRWPLAIRRLGPAVGGGLLLVGLVHGVETARFAMVFAEYRRDVADLAMGARSDPGLGDGAFVSASRIGAGQALVGWSSTTPFLSALVSPGLAPARLVIDPRAGYVWFDCAAARANAARPGAVPAATRGMVARYTCLHR